MANGWSSYARRAVREGADVLRTGRKAAEAGLRITTEVGKMAMDASVQVVAAARAAGVPMPESYAHRVQQRVARQEQAHHEQTAFHLGSLYLRASKAELRGEPYPVNPDEVLRVLSGFCEETGVDVERVMDPFAGAVVRDSLGNQLRD